MSTHLRGVSDITDQYLMVMLNDRKYYDLLANAISHQWDYCDVMKLMASMRNECRGRKLVQTVNPPNRIQLYLHMAATMDRLHEVHHGILDYAARNRYLVYKDNKPKVVDPPIVKQPKEVTTVEFSTVHYINDKDIKDHTDEELIGLISREQDNIRALSSLNVESTHINDKIATHKDNVARLIKILDAKSVAPQKNL